MASVSLERNVVVGNFGGIDLTVDVARPSDTDGPAPALLFLPGGGWLTADRSPLPERYGISMAERGFVCVTGEYRVLEQGIWPAAIQDVKAIIRWMRANAAGLGLDPERIALGGKSAGGHLTLLAGATNGSGEFEESHNGNGVNAGYSSRVAAVIGVAPVADISEYWRRPHMIPYTAADASDAAIRAANPIDRVDGDYPPTMLLHGTNDDRVPHEMTLRMFHTLERNGVPADLCLFAEQDHMFDRIPAFSQAIVENMARFLGRYVGAADAAKELAVTAD